MNDYIILLRDVLITAFVPLALTLFMISRIIYFTYFTRQVSSNSFRLTARLAERRLDVMTGRKNLYKRRYKQMIRQKLDNDINSEIEKSLFLMSMIYKDNHLHDELLNSPMLLFEEF